MAGEIVVVAGTNGAGKSTIAGAYFAYQREAYYNLDEHTRELVKAGVPLPRRTLRRGSKDSRHCAER